MKLEEIFESDSTPADNFIIDFRKASSKRSYDDSESAKARKIGDAVVTLTVVGEDKVSLSEISVAESKARNGSGGAALKVLTRLADKHKVTIVGYAQAMQPKNKTFMTSKQLVSWYIRNGFSAKGNKISYTPK